MMPTSARALRAPSLALLLVAWATAPLGCSKKDGEDALRTASITSTKPALPPAPAKCEAGADGKCSPSPSCSPSCEQVASPECVKCEASGDCADFANNCESPLLSPEERGVCYAIISCFHRTSCFDGPSTTLGSCYCGKLPLKECLAAPWTGPGAPDGACRDVMLKGMPGATKHSHVLGNMTTRVEHAAGAMALSRMNCQKIGFRKQCASVCGFGDIKPDPLPTRRPAEALNR